MRKVCCEHCHAVSGEGREVAEVNKLKAVERQVEGPITVAEHNERCASC